LRVESDQAVGGGDIRASTPEEKTGSIDLYLVPVRRQRFAIFLTRRSLSAYAQSETDRFLRFIRRMMRSKNRVVRWVGRVSRMGHRYYQKLEDRIDPIERMVKALNYPGPLVIWHGAGVDAPTQFREFVGRQAFKHRVWVGLDGFLTAVAIVLAPFMAPIPGPNVAFFYPFLRFLSHLQALRGARRGQGGAVLIFRVLPDLDAIGSAEVPAGGDEAVEGLREFLRRVG
jgi:hypothetical protein